MSDKCMHCHNEETCPEGAKTKARSEEEQQKLLNRLSRIEGQIRGIKKMVEENRYCTDILTQSAAAAQAMNAFSRELLDEHLTKLRGGKSQGRQHGNCR